MLQQYSKLIPPPPSTDEALYEKKSRKLLRIFFIIFLLVLSLNLKRCIVDLNASANSMLFVYSNYLAIAEG